MFSLNTPVKDMISTIANEDSIPSWLVNNKPLWLCEMNEEGEGDGSSSEDYVLEPFPEHELEPYGWHDILATLDVCANVHATRHCDDEGYDIVSLKMVSIINEEESEAIITSGSYDEEKILEGPGADESRIQSIINTQESSISQVMPVKMEISSVEDLKQNLSGEDMDSSDENDREVGNEFYDAADEFPGTQEVRTKRPNRRERRRAKKLTQAMLKLRNGKNVQLEINLGSLENQLKQAR